MMTVSKSNGLRNKTNAIMQQQFSAHKGETGMRGGRAQWH